MKAALKKIGDNNGLIEFKVKVASSCETAANAIQRAVQSEPIDLVLLDINLLPSRDGTYVSGEDVGLDIRKYFPNAKIIALTSHHHNFRLHDLLRNLNPEGFLVKREVNFKKLIDAVNSVIEDCPYYSRLVLKLMRRHIANDFVLDSIDRRMLYEISKGAKMKYLADVIPLSISALEIRKRHLKQVFSVDDGDDRTLVAKAEQSGFL